MKTPLILLFLTLVPLALALAILLHARVTSRARSREETPGAAGLREQTEVAPMEEVEVQVLPVEPPAQISSAVRDLLRQAFRFARQHHPEGRQQAAEFLARHLGRHGVPAVGREVDDGIASVEDFMVGLPGFYARHGARGVVLLSLTRRADNRAMRESYLAVAVSAEQRLAPVLQKILGHDWRRQVLAEALDGSPAAAAR